MKINILDPGLNFKAGHHFDEDRKLVKWLVEAGHDVHVYGFARMTDETIAEFEPFSQISRLFRLRHYERPERADLYAGDLYLHDQHKAIVIKDLKSVRKADKWIWPTFRAPYLDACVHAAVDAEVVGCIHEDPGIQAKTPAAMLWRLAFLKANQSGLRHTLGTIEPELRHRFMPLVPDGRFMLFPHPYDGPVIAQPKPKLKKIGFFGYQRGEKGSHQIVQLLNLLLADEYEIVFHDSNSHNNDLQHPKIQTLRYVDDIMQPIADCDLVVLPYDTFLYDMKGSGILNACLSLGVPATAPFGTIPGRLIEEARSGPLFPHATAQAMYAAIKFADRNFDAYASNAHRWAKQFVQRNGVAAYAQALLSEAQG